MTDHRSSGTEIVDVLRGLAMLWVFSFHAAIFAGAPSWLTPITSTGYLGVVAFFVLSGFCLAWPFAREMHGFGRAPSWGTFYFRRLLKIGPGYVLVLVVAVFLASPDIGPAAAWASFVPHVLGLNSFSQDPLGNVDAVFWSLAIELQFYVVFPLLVAAMRRSSYGTVAVLFVVAIAYRWVTAAQPEPVWRELPAFLDAFGAGMLAAWALVARQKSGRRYPMWEALGQAVLLVAAVAVTAFRVLTGSSREAAGVFGNAYLALALAVFIVAGSRAPASFRRIVANPILIGASVISYQAYLWHTIPMIVLWRAHAPAAVILWGSVGATLVIATALTYALERPILALAKPHSFALPWRSILAYPMRTDGTLR